MGPTFVQNNCAVAVLYILFKHLFVFIVTLNNCMTLKINCFLQINLSERGRWENNFNQKSEFNRNKQEMHFEVCVHFIAFYGLYFVLSLKSCCVCVLPDFFTAGWCCKKKTKTNYYLNCQSKPLFTKVNRGCIVYLTQLPCNKGHWFPWYSKLHDMIR